MTKNIKVIVPYRPDHGHRDRLWAFVRENYWAHQPFEILTGQHLDGPFNRSKAINDAAGSCDWDLAIIADADTWVPAKQLHTALMTAKISKHLTLAFDAVVELSQPCTEDLLSGRTPLSGSFNATKVRTRELETQSSMLVIHRELWDAVGGFDPRFKGYAGEDNAWYRACSLVGGEPKRISGNAYHLWHSPAGRHGIDYKRNLNLWGKYKQARTVEELRAVQCLPVSA
jgi:hypothetical protein